MAVHLEPFGRYDLEFVRQLRNGLRHHFFNTRPIDPWEQEEWYRKYLTSNTLMWVIWHHNHRVGVISRTFIQGLPLTYEIGNLMLLPSHQGKGIMLEAMRQLTALAPNSFYVAHVKVNNAASLRCFKRASFWRVPKKWKRKKAKKSEYYFIEELERRLNA